MVSMEWRQAQAVHTDGHIVLQYSGRRALPILGDLRGDEPMNQRFDFLESRHGPSLDG